MLKESYMRVESFENGAGHTVKLIHVPTGIETGIHYNRSKIKAIKMARKELEQLVKDAEVKG